MIAQRMAVVIHVTDFKAAMDYYINVLGFQEEFRLPDYGGIELGAIFIYLSGPGNQGLKKLPGSAHVCVDCDEVDSYYREISSRAASISVPLDDRFYGIRDFAVIDPDGNTLIFGSEIAASHS